MGTTYSGADVPTLMALIADVEVGGAVSHSDLNVTLGALTLSATGVITGLGVDPSAAFEDLIHSVDPAFVVLAELQPMEMLGSWTAAGGGLTNTYYCSFPAQIATSIVPGGLYRRLDFVRQNDTQLAERSSAALVNSNLGSYFYDTALERLYVSTTSGANPDTFALVGAWFSLFFSTSSVSFSDQPLYAPLLTGPLPTLESEMPDPLFGATISDTGSLEFVNGDKLFDRLQQQYIWRNKTATIRLGGIGLNYLDYVTVAELQIHSLSVDDETAVMRLEEHGTIFNRTIPPRTFGETGLYSNLGDGVSSRVQPWLLGVVRECPMALTDKTGNGTYTTVEALTPVPPTVDAVYAVNRSTREKRLLAVPTDYTVTVYTITIVNPDYHYDTHDILASLTWSEGAASFGQMVYALLLHLGEDITRIDVSSFFDSGVNTKVLGEYLHEPVSAAEVLRKLERSENAQVYVKNGKWTARAITPDIPATYRELRDADFASWEADGQLQSVLTEVRVQYDERPGTGDISEASSSSLTTRYSHESTDTHRVTTSIVQSMDASLLAEHLRFFSSRPAARFRFEERGLSLMTAHVGDLVAVWKERAPVARTGAYEGHFLRLIRIEKRLGPVPTVSGVLEDLGGQVDRVGRYLPAGTDLSWSAATPEQKARYLFYSDANGYIDPADPKTRHSKVLY